MDLNRLTHHIPESVLEEVIEVLDLGEKTHPPGDAWKTEQIVEHIEHAVGHFNRGISCERLDPDTHKHHLSHAICRVMFALALQHKEEENETIH